MSDPSGSSRKPNLDSAPILLPLCRAPSTAPNSSSPPLHLLPNGKPSPSRIIFTQPETSTNWISTNHVFPSAYPRSHPNSTSPPCDVSSAFLDPQPFASSDPAQIKAEEGQRRKFDLAEWERRKQNYTIDSHFPPSSKQEAEQLANEYISKSWPQLWSTVQRIVPVSQQPSISSSSSSPDNEANYTLLLAHANGFHKETWEPMLPSLLNTLSQKQNSQGQRINIDEIWSIDTFGSGENGILNRQVLGETVSWFDGARDILQLIYNYLPQVSSKLPKNFGPRWLNDQLPLCQASQVAKDKKKGRKIIAVGHSFSGAALSILAGTHPDIFEALILVDPVMFHKDNFSSMAGHPYKDLEHPASIGAVVRRDVWPTPKDALDYFLSRPFWQAWNRKATESYARFALRPILPSVSPWQDSPPNPNQARGWTLAMSKWSECAFFATSALGAFALAALKHGNFNGKVHHFVMSESVQTEKDTEAITDAIKRFGGKTERLQGQHLIVQQSPEVIGQKIAIALINLLGSGQGSYQAPSARL
ncbi:unnamed protein product [Sympodiomycopsis kandeliae]